jgi:hypothetical protein
MGEGKGRAEMIDSPTLRKLGALDSTADVEVLREACNQAADTIEYLCKEIDGCVRVAADALQRARANEG